MLRCEYHVHLIGCIYMLLSYLNKVKIAHDTAILVIFHPFYAWHALEIHKRNSPHKKNIRPWNSDAVESTNQLMLILSFKISESFGRFFWSIFWTVCLMQSTYKFHKKNVNFYVISHDLAAKKYRFFPFTYSIWFSEHNCVLTNTSSKLIRQTSK